MCFCLLAFAPAASAATITVNTTSVSPANDGACTLPEAIIASNTNTSSGASAGECAAGSGADTINFSALFTGDVATSTITTSSLPPITQTVTIAGGNCGSPKPCVGFDADTGGGGFNVGASNVTISGIAITGAASPTSVAIFDSTTTTGLVVRNTWLGIRLDQTPEHNTNGIIVLGDNAVIGGTGPNARNVIANTQTSGVRILGADNTTVQGNFIGTLPDGTTTTGVSNFSGVQVVGDATVGTPTGTLIGGPDSGTPGICDAACNVISNTVSSGIDLQGSGGGTTPAGQTRIEGNFVGLDATGASLGGEAVRVDEADNITVGGDAARRNYVGSVDSDGGATNLEVVANFVGLNAAGTARITDGTIQLGSVATPISGPMVIGNRVARENAGGGAGIELNATGAVVQGNTIGIGTGGQDVGGGGTAISSGSGSANQIGGAAPGQGNVIGNTGTGLVVNELNTTVAGNVIGTDATETQSHPVTNNGILLSGGGGNVVGGTTAASENVIVNVGADAITLIGDGTDFMRILRNRGSGAVGQEFIDFTGVFGPGNGPTGPNEGIERPVITTGATSQEVSGTAALPGAVVRVYRTASTAGATGPRDVIAYVGQATADGSGNWTLNCPSAGCEVGLPGAGQVTANQTSVSGNSSEMANPVAYADLAPETTITSGPADGETTTASPQFGFSSSEPSSTFACSIDGGPFGSCSSPKQIGPLADGQHTFQVQATDSTANQDSTPASRSFTVDATGPTVTIDSGPAEGSTVTTAGASFGFSASETGSTFECRLDGGSFGACSTPFEASSLAEGAHTFEVRATDALGNVGPTAGRSFSVDLPDPPAPAPAAPPPAATPPRDTTAPNTTIRRVRVRGRIARITFSGTDAGVSGAQGLRFQCKLDRGRFRACRSPKTYRRLKKGRHTVTIRAIDAAGNVDRTPARKRFRV